MERTLKRWDDWSRSDHAKITAGAVSAVVATGMLFMIILAVAIAIR
ncbi:hypothetical protein CI1B_14750 [Bradyrhizobium ivorense]|uniref:Uncharacterized protein n=1 Tax=Bradyrhizobium ivorense TaxID=2511166 RepID=A0A508SY51_9BRAD|nr:hypothetical protein [Bradyrhizobium ivorense]VIO66354.1 hypothetical protein CI1B_14750 [Bradyrhizobium ivorense]